MKLRLMILICGLGFVASGCSPDVVGPGTPECADPAGGDIATATVIQLQALPSAEWGPCIDELRVGWEYTDQFAESGRVVFWLGSDRVGDEFLEVELTETCDTSGAEFVGNPDPEIERLVRIREEPGELPVAVIPVAPRHSGDARALVTETIGVKLKGRMLAPYVDDSTIPAPQRIERALRTVGVVLVLDDPQVMTDTVELRRAGHDPRVDLGVAEALEEIADDLGSPVYRAEWIHVFDGGCIVYRFDAKGVGAETIALEVSEALGFYPLARLRETARRAGFDV